MSDWTVAELVDAIQYISDKKSVNIYLMPKDHEKEYERLDIHAVGLGEVTGDSLDIFVEKADKKLESIFNKHDDLLVADAVLTLFKKRSTLEIFNKKAIYLYLREITGLNTKQVVNNLNKLRKRYRTFKTKWENSEI